MSFKELFVLLVAVVYVVSCELETNAAPKDFVSKNLDLPKSINLEPSLGLSDKPAEDLSGGYDVGTDTGDNLYDEHHDGPHDEHHEEKHYEHHIEHHVEPHDGHQEEKHFEHYIEHPHYEPPQHFEHHVEHHEEPAHFEHHIEHLKEAPHYENQDDVDLLKPHIYHPSLPLPNEDLRTYDQYPPPTADPYPVRLPRIDEEKSMQEPAPGQLRTRVHNHARGAYLAAKPKVESLKGELRHSVHSLRTNPRVVKGVGVVKGKGLELKNKLSSYKSRRHERKHSIISTPGTPVANPTAPIAPPPLADPIHSVLPTPAYAPAEPRFPAPRDGDIANLSGGSSHSGY